MDPLEVHALNSQFEMIAPNIPYTNLQWCRKYYECGHFEMTVPSSIFSTDWKYIYTEDRPETGIVQKVEFSDTEHVAGGDDIITISGFFTDKWLDDYVFLVEETDVEKEYIQKPPPVLAKKPTLYVDKDGNVYNKSHGKYITSGGKETDLTDADVTVADVKVSNGVSQGKWSNDLYYSNKFNYYKDKNGAIYQVNSRGEEEKLADSFTSIFATGGTQQGAVYKNQDGSFTWVPEVAYNKDFTNFRQCEKWEENTKGLEVITVEEGTFAIKYRTVKGAYQLRTEIDEVGKEADNIETILKWGARIFGDGVYFDKPDFHGVKKVLDPSLKKFGELCREELQSIGASVRMFYAFKSNRVVMQIWRGLDRTQDQDGEPVKPAFPVGYVPLEYIQSTGTEWIDSGVVPDQDTVVTFDFQYAGLPIGFTGHFCTSNNDNTFFAMRTNNGNTGYCVRYADGTLQDVPHSGAMLDRHVFRVGAGEARIDNAAVVQLSRSKFEQVEPLPILGIINTGGSVTTTGPMKVYGFTANGGGYDVDLKPAKRVSDGALGLVDTVSGEFHSNSGSGSFVAGPELPVAEPEKPRKNPFVVFSDEWGNLNGFTASRDESNYKNKAYVLFEYDEPNNWREDGSPSGIWYRDWGNSDSPADQLENSDAGYHIPYTTKRGYETVRLDDGLNDAEIYIDLRSEKPEFDGDWPRDSTTVDETKALVGMRQRYEQWAKHYKEEGLKALENDYCVVTNIDAGTFDSNKYLEDYDLGDKVDIIISKIGMSETARIIEINEVYESGNADIMLTMGDQVVSIGKKARLV